MTDKPLRVKLVIVCLLEHNLNQQISHLIFVLFTRKVNVDESFVSPTFNPDTVLPNVRWLGFFYRCNFAEILFASLYLGENYMMPFFASGHRLA